MQRDDEREKNVTVGPQVVRRRKHPVIVSDTEPPIKCVLNKTRKDDKFGVVLGCRYFIKKIHPNHGDLFANLQEGDEVIKVRRQPSSP